MGKLRHQGLKKVAPLIPANLPLGLKLILVMGKPRHLSLQALIIMARHHPVQDLLKVAITILVKPQNLRLQIIINVIPKLSPRNALARDDKATCLCVKA